MPSSLKSFTKSSWLAFFAELTAKITHHNAFVVIEGCEIIRRLLVSRVSVAAFLEEGTLLTQLVDSIAGNVLLQANSDDGSLPAIVDKLLFTQLETLSLLIDMMVSFHADKEPYYCLLVVSRAGDILLTLVELLQRQHPRFFGILAMMVQALLRLPLGREVRDLPRDESLPVGFRCQLQQLREAVARQGPLLSESVEILQALSVATDGAMRYCSRILLGLAEHRLGRAQSAFKGDLSSVSETQAEQQSFGLHRSCEDIIPDKSVEKNIKTTDTGRPAVNNTMMSIITGSESCDRTILEGLEERSFDTEYKSCIEGLAKARSHNEFLTMMNRLWCLTIACGNELQRSFNSSHFARAFRRFFEAVPTTYQDHVVFTSVLLWLSHMLSGYSFIEDTRESILSVVGIPLIKFVLQELQNSAVASSSPVQMGESNISVHTAATNIGSISFSYADSSLSHLSTVGEKVVPLVQRPSIRFVVLSFFLIAERFCDARQMEKCICEAGLFTMIENLIRNVENIKSVLIDTPTTATGSLSDDVYLVCAMRCARTENVTLAALSCKLLASVIWNHHAVLKTSRVSDTVDVLQRIIPLLLKIVVNNPTLTSAKENVSGSALHYLPSCQRASRYTSLGECSLVALDACFWLMGIYGLNAVCLSDVILTLPALSRATRDSIHPQIRGSVYRFLTRLCTSPADVMMVFDEMPSLMKAAVVSVLEYSTTAPQWGVAAAAEWLTHAIRIASSDLKTEQFCNFMETELPVKLLGLVSCNGITCATAAMLFLLTFLFEHQKRLEDTHHTFSAKVILPCGRQSLDCWFCLLRVATQNNERLATLREKLGFTPAYTKDAFSRFLGAVEGISVQFSFICSLSRGLIFLFTSHSDHREFFSHEVIYNFILSVFALPPPDTVLDMLALRFGVKFDHHATLKKEYEGMLNWTIEFCFLWFVASSCTVHDFPALPASFYRYLCDIIKNRNISQPVCVNVCALVSKIIDTSSLALCSALDALSGDLFSASLSLDPVSFVSGMQCRLVAHFAAANAKAHEKTWFAAKLTKLEEAVSALKANAGVLAVEEMESIMTSLSFLSSVLSFPDCPALSRNFLHSISLLLRTLLGYETTRRVAFQAVEVFAHSSQGRRTLLHEVTTSGDPISRTCFGRVVGITLCVQPLGGEHSQLQKENNNALRRMPLSERGASKTALMAMGLDICATACGKGGEPFTHVVMKLRGVEHIESMFLKYEQQHAPVPLGLFRLLAAISFYPEAQMALMRQGFGELMTIIVESAGTAGSVGTLSLLTLRNLCFNSQLKIQLCQDRRIVLALKAALMAKPRPLQQLRHDENIPSLKNGTKDEFLLKYDGDGGHVSLNRLARQAAPRQSKKMESAAHSCGSLENVEILRRQELAATAFWSLMYDSQRGKSYVRDVFNQTPAINVDRLMMSFEGVCVHTPELEKHTEKMLEAIENIRLLLKGTLCSVDAG